MRHMAIDRSLLVVYSFANLFTTTFKTFERSVLFESMEKNSEQLFMFFYRLPVRGTQQSC